MLASRLQKQGHVTCAQLLHRACCFANLHTPMFKHLFVSRQVCFSPPTCCLWAFWIERVVRFAQAAREQAGNKAAIDGLRTEPATLQQPAAEISQPSADEQSLHGEAVSPLLLLACFQKLLFRCFLLFTDAANRLLLTFPVFQSAFQKLNGHHCI